MRTASLDQLCPRRRYAAPCKTWQQAGKIGGMGPHSEDNQAIGSRYLVTRIAQAMGCLKMNILHQWYPGKVLDFRMRLLVRAGKGWRLGNARAC